MILKWEKVLEQKRNGIQISFQETVVWEDTFRGQGQIPKTELSMNTVIYDTNRWDDTNRDCEKEADLKGLLMNVMYYT